MFHFCFRKQETAYEIVVRSGGGGWWGGWGGVGCFFFQAEDGIRDRSPSRGLGDVYKRQALHDVHLAARMSRAFLNKIKQYGLLLEMGERWNYDNCYYDVQIIVCNVDWFLPV